MQKLRLIKFIITCALIGMACQVVDRVTDTEDRLALGSRLLIEQIDAWQVRRGLEADRCSDRREDVDRMCQCTDARWLRTRWQGNEDRCSDSSFERRTLGAHPL